METHTNEYSIDSLLIRLKDALMRLWALVLVLAVVLSVVSYMRGKRSFVPMYESTVIFTVSAEYVADDIFSTTAYYDQYAARQMAASFSQILSTQVMRDLVVQRLPKGYVNATATATAVADSNLLVLRASSAQPQDAYDYLNAVIECYPQVAQYITANPKLRIMQAPMVASESYNYFDGTSAAVKGGFLGVVAGLALIVVYALLIRTIQTADELKAAVNLPIVVALPKVTAKKRRKKASGLITSESDPNMAESLRGLRVKVKKLMDDPDKKIVLITSTIAGEGKTTVAINLARVLAHDGHKVLLLDADFHSQSVARAMGDKAVGSNLLDCLRDPSLNIRDLIRTNDQVGLSYVSGRSADNRHYSINVHTLQEILRELTKEYDYVVMDTAPCEVVSDTAALCRCADCVLYVVRQNHAHQSQILDAVTALHQKDVVIAGCVLNGVSQAHRHYGYGYGYSYQRYGYGYRKYSYSKYGYSKYAKSGEE